MQHFFLQLQKEQVFHNCLASQCGTVNTVNLENISALKLLFELNIPNGSSNAVSVVCFCF